MERLDTSEKNLNSLLKSRLKSDLVLAFTIFTVPFLLYTHLLFPKESGTIYAFGLNYDHGFDHHQTFVWFLSSTLVPISLYTIWFFTSGGWFKYFLIPLIILNISQFLESLNLRAFLGQDYLNLAEVLSSFLCASLLLILDSLFFKRHRESQIDITFSVWLKNQNKNEYNKRKNKILAILNQVTKDIENSFIQKLYYYKIELEKDIIPVGTNVYQSSNGTHKRFNLVLAILLLLTIFLWFSNRLVRRDVMELNFWIFSLDSNGFNDVFTYIWFLKIKLIVLLPSVFWFITLKDWWRYAILSPIIIYGYQFWEASRNVDTLDAISNLKLVPFVIIILGLLIFLSRKFKNKILFSELHSFLTKEIDNLLTSMAYSSQKEILEKYDGIKNQTSQKSQYNYLNDLLNLKKDIQNKLNN